MRNVMTRTGRCIPSGGSDRVLRLVMGAVCLVSLLGGIVASPPILGPLAAVDGEVEPGLVRLGLWGLTVLGVAVALLTGLLAWRPALGRWLGRGLWWQTALGRRLGRGLWQQKWRLAVWMGMLLLLATAGLAVYYCGRNHKDVVGHLDRSLPLRKAALEARRVRSEEAAWFAVATHFATRPTGPALPPYQLWGQSPEESARRAKHMLSGDLGGGFRDERFIWEPGQTITWEAPTSKAILFGLQRQVFLFDLLRADNGVTEGDGVARAVAFVREWRRGNRFWPNFNPDAWTDDPVANRMDAHRLLMQRWRQVAKVPPADEFAFLESLLVHAEHLMDAGEYNVRSNHGVMQNCALLGLALEYPEFAASQQWRRTAIERMASYLREHVTSEGVSLELSPGYHAYITRMVLWFYASCARANVRLDPSFETRLRRMLGFCREILNPDVSLPLISDTGPGRQGWPTCPWDELPDWPEVKALHRAFEATDRPPNEPGVRFWPEAGYFILRIPAPEWSRESAMLLTLKAGPMSHAHWHPDALSITLFGQGRPLLVGPGYPDWFGPVRREVLISTPSQNTVSVDGRTQEMGGATVLFADIPNANGLPRQGPVFAAIQAESRLYPGVRHRRTVFYGPVCDAVLLVDELTADQVHTYRQHFRYGSGLHANIETGRITLKTASSPDGALLVAEGWLVPGTRAPAVDSPIFRNVSELTGRGRDVTFLTLVTASGFPRTRSITRTGRTVCWRGEGGVLTVDLPVTPEAYVWEPARVSGR